MTGYVSAERVERLGTALRVMLAPVGEAERARWLGDVVGAACALVDADLASVVDVAGGRVLHSTADERLVRVYEDYYGALDLGTREMMRRRLEVGHLALVEWIDERVRGEFYTDYVVPNRLRDTMSLNTFTAAGPSLRIIFTYLDRRLDSPELERNEALLRALAPGFRAAVDALRRWEGDAGWLAQVIDGLSDALAICAADGSVVHRNPALAALLSADPQAERVVEEIGVAARDVAQQAQPRRGRGIARADPAPVGEREVRTDAMRYIVRATLAEEGALGSGRRVVVSVRSAAPPTVPDERLRERFQLTDREIAVARCLSRGMSNAQLARQLVISPHTARHHTERVLRKLGITARAQVAAAIEGAG